MNEFEVFEDLKYKISRDRIKIELSSIIHGSCIRLLEKGHKDVWLFSDGYELVID